MPLHAEREAVARRLDRLGQVVDRRPAGDRQPVADPLDALVVVRLGAVELLARDPRRERALRQPDVVVRVVERAERAPVVLVAVVVREVLVQRPAARDVHHLHAAADAEERQVTLHRPRRERQLERVALGRRARGRGVRLGAVGRRVHVGAAREQQAVEHVEHAVGVLDGGRVGREQQRDAAGALDGVDVAAGQQDGLGVPDAPARALERGAQADDGWGGHDDRG
jgi:hypothetical protein